MVPRPLSHPVPIPALVVAPTLEVAPAPVATLALARIRRIRASDALVVFGRA